MRLFSGCDAAQRDGKEQSGDGCAAKTGWSAQHRQWTQNGSSNGKQSVYEISDAIVEYGLVDGVRSFVRQQRVRRTAENSSAVCR